MGSDDLVRKSAVELASGIAAGEIGPVQLLEACLDRIERINPPVNAIITLAADQAMEAAKAAEKAVSDGGDLGPLHGLPVVVKDVTETAGIRTTYASPMFADYVPDHDAEAVARLRRAGAIILGKTNTPEFAAGANTVNEVFGATRNPWNTDLSPAGSSGGSAVAVAAGMVPLAHGTDFGCSIRIPASFNGIVGVRTTPGLVPNDPMPLPWDPGQVHSPLARSAEDAALMLDGMTGLDPLWPISVAPPWDSAFDIVHRSDGVKGLKFAYAPDIAGIGVDPEVEAMCRAAADRLASDGAEVEALDFDVSEGRAAYLTLRAEWMVGQQYKLLDRLDEMGQNLAGNVREGLALGVADTQQAQQVRESVWRKFRDLLRRVDFLITPTAPVLPFPVEQNFPSEIGGRKLDNYVDWIAPDFLVTMVSLVGGSVPVGLSKSGLPIGLQIVAPRFSEPQVLSVAKHLQQAMPVGWPPAAAMDAAA